jgi:hypothetical protein
MTLEMTLVRIVNVFYNPGAEGATFDYGYRGTPTAVPLRFDASKAAHRFEIEWDPCEIRWFVDGWLWPADRLRRRADWLQSECVKRDIRNLMFKLPGERASADAPRVHYVE